MRHQRASFRINAVRFLGGASVAAVLGAAALTAGVSAQAPKTPTFNGDVAPIIFDKCASCHRPGAVGAMSLTSYREVRPWARSIKARVVKREMPPWSADARFGHFLNDSSLTQAQVDTIAAWVDGGMPEGTGSAPPMPNYVAGGWRTINGRGPDVILEMPMEFELPAEGQIPVFRIWDKNPFKEDVFIQALQIMPSDLSVTHHSALYGRELPKGTTLKETFGWKNGPTLKYIPTYEDGSIVNILTGNAGFSNGIEDVEGKAEIKAGDRVPVLNKTRQPTEEDDERLMFYLPGSDFQVFPEGSAKRIKASNALMWELHYSPNGKPTKDRERIGLWLAKPPVEKEVHVIRNGIGQHIIENGEVGGVFNLPAIPPYAADWKITAIQPFTEDVTLASMQPHMHLRGKDMTYVATYPDGHEEVLLSVPKYDFNWQNTYMPVKPVKLPAGTVLKTVGHYDNSVANKVNPQPNRPALWSEQTWDEMYNAWTEITYDGENGQLAASAARARQAAAGASHPITTVVGCAVPGTPLKWTLTSASRMPEAKGPNGAPIRPAHNITKPETEAAAKLAAGTETYELIGVSDFVTNEQSLTNPLRKSLYPLERVNATGALVAGRRVAAKGVFIPGSPARINLTSVVPLEGSCQQSATAN